MSVFGRNQVSDKDLLKTVNQRLARTGTSSQSKVNVSVQQGAITLTGTLQYAIQRAPILKAIENIPGVRRVSDQLQVVDKKKSRHDADADRYYSASQQSQPSADDTPETAPATESTIEPTRPE